MAFGANTIGSGLTSGLTGNINKAYILMHQPDLNPTRKADSSGNFGLEGAAQLLQTGVSDNFRLRSEWTVGGFHPDRSGEPRRLHPGAGTV